MLPSHHNCNHCHIKGGADKVIRSHCHYSKQSRSTLEQVGRQAGRPPSFCFALALFCQRSSHGGISFFRENCLSMTHGFGAASRYFIKKDIFFPAWHGITAVPFSSVFVVFKDHTPFCARNACPKFPPKNVEKIPLRTPPRYFRLELGELLDGLAGPGKDTENVEADLLEQKRCIMSVFCFMSKFLPVSSSHKIISQGGGGK